VRLSILTAGAKGSIGRDCCVIRKIVRTVTQVASKKT
jgi:hypothetical protein